MGILTCKLTLKTIGTSKALSSFLVLIQWKGFWIIVKRILKKHIWYIHVHIYEYVAFLLVIEYEDFNI